jgi:hypothetical protein
MNFVDISVVIASIGEDDLNGSIKSLLNNTFVPREIIIVFAKNTKFDLANFPRRIVRSIMSDEVAQVKQRLIGISAAHCNFILQSDSRVLWSKNAIEKLYTDIINLGLLHVISPRTTQVNSIDFLSLFTTLGADEGRVLDESIPASFFSKCGFPKSPYRYSLNERVLHKTDWINGVCLYHKSLSAKNNYYPFIGKAYCEDIINSCRLKNKGVNLWIRNDAHTFTKVRGAKMTLDSLNKMSRALLFSSSLFVKNNFFYRIGRYCLFGLWYIKHFLIIFIGFLIKSGT